MGSAFVVFAAIGVLIPRLADHFVVGGGGVLLRSLIAAVVSLATHQSHLWFDVVELLPLGKSAALPFKNHHLRVDRHRFRGFDVVHHRLG